MRDRICMEFDRLREEIYSWPVPDRPKPKDPIVIDLDAPLEVSDSLRNLIASKEDQ